jgi:hypothetical protein
MDEDYGESKRKKAKLSEYSDNQVIQLKKQSQGFPLGGAQKFANMFTAASNAETSNQMRYILQGTLLYSGRVTKHLQKRSPTGETSLQVLTSSIEEFLIQKDHSKGMVAKSAMVTQNISSFSSYKSGNTMISVDFNYSGVFIVQLPAPKPTDVPISSENVYLQQHSVDESTVEEKYQQQVESEKSADIEDIVEEIEVKECDNGNDKDFVDESDDTYSTVSSLTDDFRDSISIDDETTIEANKVDLETSIMVTTEVPFTAKGSYLLYINEDNQIYNIETFFSFL